MFFALLRRRLRNPYVFGKTHQPVLARRHRFQPKIESLETRSVPSIVTWNGGDGDWGIGANWNTGVMPGPNDDVVIEGAVMVTHSAGADAIHSLNEAPGATLDLAGGSLAFATTFQIDGSLLIDGGSLDLLNKDLDGNGTTTVTPGASWTILGGGLHKSVIATALDNQGTLEVRGGVSVATP
jgi:hypothetical protein